jgi:hypothetical protein
MSKLNKDGFVPGALLTLEDQELLRQRSLADANKQNQPKRVPEDAAKKAPDAAVKSD